MSLFRSEDMNLCKLIVTKDNAFDIVEALITLNEVFIVNLNPDEQPQKLTYSKSISKWNEIISNLDYIISEWGKYRVPLNKIQSFKDFMQKKEKLQRTLKLSKVTIIDYLTKEVKNKHDFLKEQTVRIESMCQDYDDLVEYFKVVEASQDILSGEAFKEVRSRIESKHDLDFKNIHERKSIDHEEAKHLIASSFISEK